jgi:hypothetical protein
MGSYPANVDATIPCLLLCHQKTLSKQAQGSLIFGQVIKKWWQNVTNQCEHMGSQKIYTNIPICTHSTPHTNLLVM